MGTLKTKRIYEPAEEEDGKRILVDRLWPRGMKKDRANLAVWAKEVTPSAELRKLYHTGGLPFEGFAAAYLEELEANDDAKAFVQKLHEELKENDVTLVYATKNIEQNHVQVLVRWLKHHLKEIS
ncbi:DUF488 domain-containing protein [uncultured Selenomonas sp.]|uniref:DUF488 domain-containing protein n=1 Tax=uncultured Selenomonas sp. TaxID=159275 RepID=UPI0025D5C6D7|nr:DUF488 family protein [uncultured Selenomonas sp.]